MEKAATKKYTKKNKAFNLQEDFKMMTFYQQNKRFMALDEICENLSVHVKRSKESIKMRIKACLSQLSEKDRKLIIKENKNTVS